jgi:hypothetical protein
VRCLALEMVLAPVLLAPVLAAAAGSTHVELVDEIVQVPAGGRQDVPVVLKQRPARVAAEYQVEAGGPEVRLALVPREGLERPGGKPPEGVLAVTSSAPSGRLRYRAPLRGEYALLVENRDYSRAAAVHLRVSLDFAADAEPGVTRLTPQRQLAVIAISFAVFFAIVTYSARRLLEGMRR